MIFNNYDYFFERNGKKYWRKFNSDTQARRYAKQWGYVKIYRVDRDGTKTVILEQKRN